MNRAAVLAAACLAWLAFPADATERITDFSSEIRVSQTGALTVTENISVNSEGDRIRHGIFRDFPTTPETARVGCCCAAAPDSNSGSGGGGSSGGGGGGGGW
jgi:hypothetical protein